MNRIAFWSAAGGLVIGFGIVFALSAFLPVEVAFNASLVGLGVALIALGLTFWDKIKRWK